MPKLSELLSANSNSVNVTSYSIAPGDVLSDYICYIIACYLLI
nr:MAG TPA: hypothetical protein [Caudoviricetes sp.]